LKPSGNKTIELLLVLVTGACLVATGLCATEGSTLNRPQAPVSHPAAGPASTHAPSRKGGRSLSSSHAAVTGKVASHTGTANYAGRRSTRPASAPAVGGAPKHSTAYASQGRGKTARHPSARRSHPRMVTAQQRLARLHLQPERVNEIQQALIREGYLQGDTTGEWDSRTREAMLRYQTMHGFPPTGLPEAKSLMKLGLGSHPLPSELDHGEVGVASSTVTQRVFSVSPTAPPVSPSGPPSLETSPPQNK
jgi:peptidoglycan hydrolase-like protein with peptidoglycan-binding domain